MENPTSRFLTIQDTDRLILLELDDVDLFNVMRVMRVNMYIAELCDDPFWNARIKRMYGGDKLKSGFSYREIYKQLRCQMSVYSLLYYCLINEFFPIIYYEIDKGVCIPVEIDDLYVEAFTNGELDLAEYLIGKGAHVEYYSDYIENNVNHGTLRVVEFLIERANRQGEDIRYETLAAEAISQNKDDILQYIIKKTEDQKIPMEWFSIYLDASVRTDRNIEYDY